MAGLDTVPRENWPPGADYVLVVPQSWSAWACCDDAWLLSLWNALARTLYESRLLHMFAVAMAPSGFIPCWRGGSPPRPGGSRSPCMAAANRRCRLAAAAPAVASSLIAFSSVYSRCSPPADLSAAPMAEPPHTAKRAGKEAPARAAGITPAAGAAIEGAAR